MLFSGLWRSFMVCMLCRSMVVMVILDHGRLLISRDRYPQSTNALLLRWIGGYMRHIGFLSCRWPFRCTHLGHGILSQSR
jgi:hypothetical protein